MVAKKKIGRKQRREYWLNQKVALGSRGNAPVSSSSFSERLAQGALRHSRVLLPKKKSNSMRAKRKDNESFGHIFSSDSVKEVDATVAGKPQRTRYWHFPDKRAGYLADRAFDGFVSTSREWTRGVLARKIALA